MAARLTDSQKKKIIADYTELRSYNATGKLNGVSPNTVKALVQGNADIARLCEEKSTQNTLDMIAYMDSRKEQAQSVIDAYLKELANPEKIEKATLNNIATALGILVDKFTKGAEAAHTEIEDLTPLAEMLKE